MRPDDLLFFGASAFVAGTIAGGIGIPPAGALLLLCGLYALFFILRLRFIAFVLIAFLFLAGNLYYAVDDYRYRASRDSLASATKIEGIITNDPRRGVDFQTATVRLTTHHARIYLRVEPYPELSYGDIVALSGDIVPPPADSYGDYMAKEHVHGTAFYPQTEVLGNDAHPLFGALLETRGYMKETLTHLFNQREAAFLSGILLGDRDEFTREFLDKLSISGTMHLTALSGLHMTIMVFLFSAVFGAIFWKSKRLKFIASFIAVALFVAMTGFKVSAIRASLMAFLVDLSKETGRLYSPRNAIAFAALIITTFNPKAPVFDLGFQLSFVAVLSIIYFAPVLKRLSLFRTSGFLAWRDILAITVAAQLGVLPLTIAHFSNFSLSAFPANVAILVIMAPLMALGFLVVGASMVSMPLAALFAKPTAFLAEYAMGIVEFFSVVRFPFNPEVGILSAVLYYSLMVWLCWRYYPSAHAHATR